MALPNTKITFLDVIYEVLLGLYGDEFLIDQLDYKAAQYIRQYITHNRNQYRSGHAQIDYHNPYCRASYLYYSTPIHASFLKTTFRAHPEITNFLRQQNYRNGRVTACTFGGGPGTEALALFQHLIEAGFPDLTRLEVSAIDREPAWVETWKWMGRALDRTQKQMLRSPNVFLSGNFICLDIMDTNRFTDIATLFDQDIFIANWVVSEISDRQGLQSLANLLEIMGQRSPDGAYLIIIDRDGVEAKIRWIFENVYSWSLEGSYSKREGLHGHEAIETIGSLEEQIGTPFRRKATKVWKFIASRTAIGP